MKEAAKGHLTTEAMMWNQDNTMSDSGMVRALVIQNRIAKTIENKNILKLLYCHTSN